METTTVLRADGGRLGPIDVAEVSLRYATTVGAFQSGPPPAPPVSTKILGLGLPGLDVLDSVTAALLGGTGTVVAGALKQALSAPGSLILAAAAAIQTAAFPVAEAAESALAPLADTFTLIQRDQPGAPASPAAAGSSADGQYKVSALRIAAAGTTAEIYLATASAGPVVFRPDTG